MSSATAWDRGSNYGRETRRPASSGRPNLRVVEAYVPSAAETIAELDAAYTQEARKLLAVLRDGGVTMARQNIAKYQLSCMGLAYCAQSDKLSRVLPTT